MPTLDPFFTQEQADALQRLALAKQAKADAKASKRQAPVSDAPLQESSEATDYPSSPLGESLVAKEKKESGAASNGEGPVSASSQLLQGAALPSSLPANTSTADATSTTSASMKMIEGGKRADLPLLHGRVPKRIKVECIKKLACFQSPSEVSDWVAKEYGLSLNPRRLTEWNPDNSLCTLGPELRDLFAETRRAYTSDVSSVAIAHQPVRLRMVQKLAEKAATSKDYAAALKAIELAAKEMGGVLEGRTTVTHQGAVTHVHGSVDDLRAELAMRLAAMTDTLPAPEPKGTVSVLPPADVGEHKGSAGT